MAGLKITRRVGQSFSAFVGDVEVKVILEEVRGPRVGVLRIIAPKEVEILRDELIRGEADHGRHIESVNDSSIVVKQAVPGPKDKGLSGPVQD